MGDFLSDVNGSIRNFGLRGVDTLTILSDGMPVEPYKVKLRLREALVVLNNPDADPLEAQRTFKLALSEVDGYQKQKSSKQIELEKLCREKQEAEKRKAEEELQRAQQERERLREEEKRAAEEAKAAEEQRERIESEAKIRRMREGQLKAAEARMAATRAGQTVVQSSSSAAPSPDVAEATAPAVSPRAQPKDAADFAAVLLKLVKDYRDPNPEGLLLCLQTLSKYIGNLAKNPSEPKFQIVNCQNKAFLSRVAAFDGAIVLLKACGFVDADDGHLSYDAEVGKSRGVDLWSAMAKVDLIAGQVSPSH